MVPDVPPNNFARHLIPYRPDKVSILPWAPLRTSPASPPETPQICVSPKPLFASPQPPISTAEAEKKQTGVRDQRRSPSCRTQCHAPPRYPEIALRPAREYRHGEPTSGTWVPTPVILGVVDRMAGSSRWHTRSLTTNLFFFSRKKPSRLLPTGEYLPAFPGGASIALS